MTHVPDDERVEELIRAYLTKQSKSVDAQGMLERVRAADASLPTAEPQRRVRWHVTVAWGVTSLAASVLIACLLLWSIPSQAQASPRRLVEQAQEAHARPVDRCYLVEVTPTPGGVLDRFPFLAPPKKTLLWTRGNDFWLHSVNPQRSWVWGRDKSGSVWLALRDGKSGLCIEPDEASNVRLLCELLSMETTRLLDDLLVNFDLAEERPQEDSLTHVITATPRPDFANPQARSLRMELHRETKVIQRLQLERIHQGRSLATVTFTLIDTRPRRGELYTLEGHLKPNAPVYTAKSAPVERARFLRQCFGALFLNQTEQP